jgi:membrane protease YdiL (CAAX protease family)
VPNSLRIRNLLAAVLFAFVHLPSFFQMKVTVSKLISIYLNRANIVVGLFYGWLYWSERFLAAILCHMLFHLLWYFFEKTNKVVVDPNRFSAK